MVTNMFSIFSSIRLNFLILKKLLDLKIMIYSTKEGLARIKAFFLSPNDNVHSEVYTFTAVV